MAYTFLQAVNASLKRAKIIQGDAGALTSFTDSARQAWIDSIIQIWNEAVYELVSRVSITGEQKEGTITLLTGVREYALPSDFESMSGEYPTTQVFINSSVPDEIFPYPGGYEQMYADQPNPDIFKGRPHFWAINKTNDKIRVDLTPQSTENNLVYTFLYDKRITLINTTDTFIFSDTIVDDLLPSVVEIFRQDKDGKPRTPIYATASFNRALLNARQVKTRRKYGIGYRSPVYNQTF